MATVNKDFKIKNGLIVEGTNATVNGNAILTETASDQYIIDLIGGETLITSVDSADFTVTGGELTIAAGSDLARDQDVSDAINDSLVSGGAVDLAINSKIDALTTDVIEEGSTNLYYTDSRVDSHLSGGDGINYSAGTISVELGVDSGLTTSDGTLKIKRSSVDTWYDANGAASTAESNANTYTDNKVLDYTKTSDLDSTIDGYGYLKSADLNGYATESYVGTAIDNLVDGAPGLLDTLNEIAAAIADDANYATTMTTALAGKQNNLTAGSNIDITSDIISVTGLDTADVAEDASNLYFTDSRAVSAVTGLNNPTYYTLSEKDGKAGVEKSAVASTLGTESINGSGIKVSDTNTGALAIDRTTVDTWYDASGTAQGIVDALDTDDIEEGVNNLYYTDARAKAEAKALLLNADKTNIQIVENLAGGINIVAENGVADSTTDDLAEGEENLYFTDERAIDAVSAADIYPNAVIINNLTKQVASSTLRETAGTFNGYAFLSTEYRSAEFLVKIAQGSHTEISKVLLTLDTSDNVAVTEYGVVATGETPLASITANVSLMGSVELKVTTVNNNSTVTVLGTLIA